MPQYLVKKCKEFVHALHSNRQNLSLKKRKRKLKKNLQQLKDTHGHLTEKSIVKGLRKVKALYSQFLYYWKIEAKWIANPILFDSSQNKLLDLKKKTIKLQKKKSRNAKAKRNAITALYNEQILNQNKSNPGLKWTAKKIDCVELAYALHAAKVFNHGKAELTQIIKAIQVLCNLTIIHPNRMFIDIQNRKKEQTKFLNELTTALEKRIIEIEAK